MDRCKPSLGILQSLKAQSQSKLAAQSGSTQEPISTTAAQSRVFFMKGSGCTETGAAKWDMYIVRITLDEQNVYTCSDANDQYISQAVLIVLGLPL